MAQIISIGASQHIDLLKARLGQETKPFEKNGLVLNLDESPAGKLTFLNCRFADFRGRGQGDADNQALLKNLIAEVISDIIMSHWEAMLLKNIIRENYYYFAEEDKETIFSQAILNINNNADGPCKSIYWFKRKNEIIHKINEFLRSNNNIVIDGFIRFRLKEYLGELKEAAEKAVDDFLMEREYKEFIQLLKYFVETQEPRLGVVHVLNSSNGDYCLFDDQLRPVKSDQVGGFFVDLIEGEINCEDLLVSALVTIAPREVVLHYCNEHIPAATLSTIRSVFGERLKECTGCDLCTTRVKN
ncbi:MAG: YtxC-like family protein [Pelotomaculum sp. PtaB.Bin104]|nr:MAG: YtxC-like family protein [Pelotomaculum sp. PtaB.Bin104]